MAKRRKKDKHLPARVYRQHNAFYFIDKQNKWHHLARNLPEAMQKWALMIEPNIEVTDGSKMDAILDRYLHEISPQKAPKTFKENQRQIKYLKAAFGHMKPDDIKPSHIYQYMDLRGKTAKVSANRDKEVLSHVFSMAIRWGLVEDNPCKHVKRFTQKPRDRYIEDWEFTAVHQLATPLLQCLMDFAYLTGLRRGDVLAIKLSDLTDEGVYVQTNKTGKKMIIEWSHELRQVVKKVKQLPRPIRGMTLFCTRKGACYSNSGISALWQRLMNKAMEQQAIKERFTFHDIRAKAASDSGLERGSKLLGHTSQATTQKSYMRLPDRVQPVK